MTTDPIKESVERLMLADQLLQNVERMKRLGMPQKEIDIVTEYAMVMASRVD